MGFMKKTKNDEENRQLEELWKSPLGGEDEGIGQIPLNYCKNILRAIQNFHHQEVVDTEHADSNVDPKNLGKRTEDTIVFKPSEIDYLTKKYHLFLKNR